MDFCVVKSS